MLFYGTPHIGSVLGDKLHVAFNGSLLAEVEMLNALSARKNGSFCDLKTRYEWLTHGMGESRETFVVLQCLCSFGCKGALARPVMSCHG